tara:strand:+ start:57 stop:701 length:645 start_codon:yes stop_codon:yes gene_type:complete
MAKEKDGQVVIAKIPIQDTRLFYRRWDNHENLNNLLRTEIESEREKDPKGLPATNAGCWRSLFKYKCEQELMKPIGMILAAWTDHYMPNEQMDAKITYWTNVNKPGGANIFHSHYRSDADISGVYYVQGYKTGIIRFATHEQMFKMIPDHMPFSSMIAHDPSDGDVLCFPSYLLHDVVPNPSNRQRISIAFNASLKLKEKTNVVEFPREDKDEK